MPPFHFVRVRHGEAIRSLVIYAGISIEEVTRLLHAAFQIDEGEIVGLRDTAKAIVRFGGLWSAFASGFSHCVGFPGLSHVVADQSTDAFSRKRV